MGRLGHAAVRFSSRSVLGVELGLIVLWLVLASVLATIAAQVADWNAMTDELVYERLAIAIGQTHSIVPHLHGQFVHSLAQLYPLLISPWFSRGYAPESLHQAHIFNAYLMSSACIPTFLLARRVTGRRWPAYTIAMLTIATPWILYSTTLLTEVAGYPAFMWALLGMQAAIAKPSRRNDVLAVLGLGLAFVGRQQLLVLAGAFPLALVLFELTRGSGPWRARVRDVLRTHVVLAAVYAALAAIALVVKATGRSFSSYSVYGSQLSGNLFPRDTLGAMVGHAADLAFGIGILPFVVGFAWMSANLVRRPAGRELHAFACIGTVTVAALVWFIAAWDIHIGNFVLDRYLYYLVPTLLLATICALLDERRPRWSLVLPVVLVAFGFATQLQEEFLWSGQFPLSTDSPIAWLYKPIADLTGGTTGTSAFLVAATVVLAALFVLGDRILPHGRLVAGPVVLMLVALPLQTELTFDELFSRNSHSSRPLTQSQSGVLDWLDRTVGTGARVTQVPYPISTDFYVSQQFWRDLEFWNKSVRYGVRYPDSGDYADAVIWFPNNELSFDPRTGAASKTLSPYVVQSIGETRFRISGVVQRLDNSVMLIDAEQPWRTDWLTSGLYDDGWMRPGQTTRIRVFAAPGQNVPRKRTLTLRLRPPAGVDRAPFSLRSNLGRTTGELRSGDNVVEGVDVCLPAHGFAEVRLATPVRASIPGDLSSSDTSKQPRAGGLLLANLSLADDVGPPCSA